MKGHKGHLLKVITFNLFHEMRSYLDLTVQNQLKALLHRSFGDTNEVAHAYHCCQLKIRCMNEHLSSPDNR